MKLNLIDIVPSVFENKDLNKIRLFSDDEKYNIFLTLDYPDITWFYHTILGIGWELKLPYERRMVFIKHLCEQDLYYFCKYILGKDRLRELPNRQMAEKIQIRNNPNKQERKLICEPRGTYKTTIASQGFPIWMIVKNPDISIQIDSETDAQAKNIFKTCKSMMENNELLRELWGDFQSKDRTWNETELVVAKRTNIRRDPTLFHSGVDSAMNGYHPDICIVDDPHSEINTQTTEQIDKVDDHYKLLTPLVDRNGLILVICTRWVKDDLAGRIIERESDYWSVISIKSCYDEYSNGKIYAEDIGLTREYLEAAKKTMGVYRFSANYENDPKPDIDKSFKMNWLRYYGDEDLIVKEDNKVKSLRLSVFLSIDASWSDKNSTGKDPTAIIAGGFMNNGDLYILDIFNQRITPTEVVDKVFEMVNRWNPLAVASEDISTQKGINKDIEIEMLKRNLYFKLDRVRHQQTSKENRILSLTPLFENGNIYIKQDMNDFIKQYQSFNPVHRIEHDDILDAVEMLVATYRDFYAHEVDEEDVLTEEEFYDFDYATGRC